MFQQWFGDASWFTSTTAGCSTPGVPEDQINAALPGFTFTLQPQDGGAPATLQLSATESYLGRFYDPNGDFYCPILFDMQSSNGWDLGAPTLVSSLVIFDRANQRVGVAPRTACASDD